MEGAVLRLVVGLLRHLLQGVSMWLVANGVIGDDDVSTLISGLALSLITAAWFVRDWWRARQDQGKAKSASVKTALGIGLCVPALTGASACGGAIPALPDVPAAVETADHGVYDGANKALAVLNAALELVDTISLVEDQEARSGNIPPEADAVFARAILAYLDAQDTARESILAGVQTWDELRAHLQPVIDKVNDLSRLADQVGVIRSRFGEWIDTLARIVMGSLTGSPVYGG